MTASSSGGATVGAPAAASQQCSGAYLYCIGRGEKQNGLEILGLGGQPVRTVRFGGLAGFVSDHPVGKVPITRENTIIHQKVMEGVMRQGDILPVRFSTIAEAAGQKTPEERIVEKVLKARRGEFDALLETMRDKVELGVKAVWNDLEAVFREIAMEDGRVRELRARIQAGASRGPQQEKAALGEAVRDALLAKKQAEGERLMAALKRIAVDHRLNKIFGDSMVLNAAFLVDRAREGEFDRAVEELARRADGRLRLRYVGPGPICNFVEIVVSWD